MEIILEDYIYIDEVTEKLKEMHYLDPHGLQKSFYKKARVFEGNGIKVLVSYKTPVALYCNGMVFKLQENHRVREMVLSNTTLRHINAFLMEVNCGGTCKAEWRNKEVR